MAGLKEKIENNIVVWMLGTLLAGFLAGIGTYEGALKMMNLEKISKDRLILLENSDPSAPTQGPNIYSIPLPEYLNSSEIELIFTKIRTSYNKKETNNLYDLLGPIRRSQLTLDTAKLQMEPLFQSLGKIENGFFVQHQFMGEQGIYRYFALNYSVKYENAEKGIVMVTVIDDGSSYQIDGMMFNRL